MKQSNKILLVDDDSEVEFLVKSYLRFFNITWKSTLSAARQTLLTEKFNLLLLDLSLPDGSGLDLCREIYQAANKSDLSIIILTAKDSKSEIVEGLDSGADDYITKPIHGPELRARVEACLRRQMSLNNSSIYKFHIFEFDMEFQKCKINQNNICMDLGFTPTEFRIFFNLARNGNSLLTRDEISRYLWQESGIHVNQRAIDCHIAHIRKKLGQFGKLIGAVYGKGYFFTQENIS